MPGLTTRISELVRAAFPAIWIQTHEHEEAYRDLRQMCEDRIHRDQGKPESPRDWILFRWNIDSLLTSQGDWWQSLSCLSPLIVEDDRISRPPRYVPTPEEALAVLPTLAVETKHTLPAATHVIVVFDNFHRLFETALGKLYIEQMSQLATTAKAGLELPGNRGSVHLHLVVLSPLLSIPVELERLFTVVEHELPDKEQLWDIILGVVESEELPSDDEKPVVLEAAAGLTRMECENATALSIVRTYDKKASRGRVDPLVLWEVKAQFLKRSGLLTLYEGNASFDQMGGVTYFREYALRLLSNNRGIEKPILRPRGLMLLGVPGSGKDQSVCCLATATGRRLLKMEIGSLMSKYVGDSDRNMREALKIADAMSPCILHVSEVEKGLAGINSDGDSGVSARIFGQLLTWLNDHTSDVFVVCTSNDVSKLPPEFSRAERFDGTFFFDLPTPTERLAIWEIYLEMFEHAEDSYDLDELVRLSREWTGAEIRACARLSAIMGEKLADQARTIIPVSRSADSKLTELRNWASGRCLSVRERGIYSKSGSASRHRLAEPRGMKRKKRRSVSDR